MSTPSLTSATTATETTVPTPKPAEPKTDGKASLLSRISRTDTAPSPEDTKRETAKDAKSAVAGSGDGAKAKDKPKDGSTDAVASAYARRSAANTPVNPRDRDRERQFPRDGARDASDRERDRERQERNRLAEKSAVGGEGTSTTRRRSSRSPSPRADDRKRPRGDTARTVGSGGVGNIEKTVEKKEHRTSHLSRVSVPERKVYSSVVGHDCEVLCL